VFLRHTIISVLKAHTSLYVSFAAFIFSNLWLTKIQRDRDPETAGLESHFWYKVG